MISLKHTMFKFALLLPMVLLLSCSKAGVDQTDPKAVAKLYLTSSYALDYKTVHSLLAPDFRQQVSVQAAAKELKAAQGDTPITLPKEIPMEVKIEGNKATVKAQFTTNADHNPSWHTVKLVQVDGKWWYSPR